MSIPLTFGISGSSYASLFTSPSLAPTMAVTVPSDATTLDLSGITFTGASIVINGTTYTSATLPSTVSVNLASKSSFTIRTIAANSTSSNPNYTDYTVNITKKSVATALNSVTIYYNTTSTATGTTTPSSSSYVGAFTNSSDLDYQVAKFKINAHSTASISAITGKILSSGTSIGNCKDTNSSDVSFSSSPSAQAITVVLTVTSEWGNTADYEVIVKREAADTTSDMTSNPTIKDQNGNSISGTWTNSGNNYTFNPTGSELDYTITKFTLGGNLPTNATATYSIYTGTASTPDSSGNFTGSTDVNFSGINAVTKKLVITVTAEDGSTQSTYTVILSREKADDDTTVNVSIYDMSSSDLNCSFNSVSAWYENTIKVPYPTAKVKINISVNTSTTKVYYNSSDVTGLTQDYNLSNTGTTTDFTFTVTPENGVSTTIKVRIIKVDPDDTTTFSIDILDALNGTSLGVSNSGNIYSHNTQLVNSTANVKISLTPDVSTTKIYKDSASGADATGTQVYTLNTNNLTTDFNFVLVTEAGTQISFKVRITKQALNNNTNVHLDAELSDGTVVTFNKSGSNWSNASDLIPYGTSIIKLKISTDIASTYVEYNSVQVSDLASTAVFNNYTLNTTATASTPTSLQFTLFTEANASGSTFIVNVYADNPDNTITTNLIVKDQNGDPISMSYNAATNVYKNDTKLPFGWTQVKYTISATKTTSEAYIGSTSIDGVEQTLTNQWNPATFTDNASEQNVTIFTQRYPNPSSGASVITIVIEQEEPSHTSTANVSTIEVTGDGNGVTYTTSDTGTSFSYTIPKGFDSVSNTTNNGYYRIDITATDSNAKIYYSQTITNTKENLLTNTIALPIGSYGSPSIVYVFVYAQDENTYTPYTFKVQDVDNRSSDASIKDIDITEKLSDGSTFEFTQATPTYNIYFDYSVKNINIVATKNDSTATWTSATSTINGMVDISSATSTTPVTLTYQLNAQNTTTGTKYTINVYRNSADNDNTISALSINSISQVFDSTGKLDVVLSRNQATAYFDFTLTSSKAKSYVTSGTTLSNSTLKQGTINLVAGGVVTISIVVKSEAELVDGGTGRVYTINIYAAEQTFELDNVEILNYSTGDSLKDTSDNLFAFDPSKESPTIQKFTVPYGAASVAEIVATLKATSSNADVTITNNGIANLVLGSGGTTVTIVVKSEYAKLNSSVTNQSKTYLINIVRENPSYDATLKELSVQIDGVDTAFTNKVFAPNDAGPYTIENVSESAASLVIKAVANDSKASVSGAGTQTISLVSNASNYYTIKVTPEAGDAYAKEYKITVSRTVVKLDTNFTIDDIEIVDTSDATTNLITYNAATKVDSFNLRGTTKTVKVSVTTPVNTSKVTIKTSLESVGIDGRTRNIAVTAGQALTIYVTCTSEDSSNSVTYEYTANVASLDTDTTLKTLTFDGTDVLSYIGGKYYVANSVTSINNIVAVANSSYATIDAIITPFVLNVGDNYLTIHVKSEDPTVTKDYTIQIVRDEDTSLSNLEAIVDGVNKITYDNSVGPYSFTVDYETTEMTVNYILNASLASNVTVTGDGLINLLPGTNNYEVVVQSNLVPTSKTTYTITVTRNPGSTDAFIESYETEDHEILNITKSNFNYSYVLPKGTTLFNPSLTFSDDTTYTDIATMNRVLVNGVNTKVIEVTSQDGSVTNKYTFTIYVADSNTDPVNDPLISDINVLDKNGGNSIYNYDPSTNSYTTDFVDYSSSTLNYSLTVPYSVSTFYLEVLTSKNTVTVKKSTTSSIIGDSSFVTYTNSSTTLQSLSEGVNTFYIYAISEYGVLDPTALNQNSDVYTITITREAANSDASLKSLTVTYINDGVTVVKNASDSELLAQEFVIQNIGNDVTSVEINGIPKVASTTVSGQIGTQVLSSLTVTDTVSGYIFTYTVTTQAEDGSKLTYTITISRGPVDLDNDKTINYIQVYDSNAKEYLGEQGVTKGEEFSVSKDSYNYTINYGAQSFTIAANKLNVSPAKIYIYESTQTPSIATTGSVSFTINKNLYGTTKTYIVYVKSQNGADSTHYSINITFEAPSTDATLLDLTADGKTVDNFSQTDNGGVYTLSIRANTIEKITIDATLSDTKSTVTGTGTFSLAVGPNSFTVTVTAQSGDINTYVINVVRDYPLPYLFDLNVVGESLLNEKDKVTQFDKDTFTYHVIVTYMTVSATIDTKVDNINYTVNCSNSILSSNKGLTRSFIVSLVEGTNTFTISVASQEGKTIEYELIIQRRGLASTNTNVSLIEITEIPEFKIDYSNLIKEYEYTVPNKISDLTVLVTPEKIADINGNGSTYEIYNASNLVSGEINKVIILITAEDGETTRAIIVNVTREEMSFEVDEKATDFECKKIDEDSYEINLLDKKPSDIKDYSKYIKFDAADKLKVDVLTNTADENCNEVIVKVSDGSSDRYVRFNLKNQYKPLKFEVDTEATEFKCENVSNNIYKIDLGHNKANVIKDYTKYIKYEDTNVNVEVLSDTQDDNCNEVVLKISNGMEEEYVKLKLESTSIGGISISSFVKDYLHWILLVIAIIILIIILICVNKDKYGSINTKRKQRQ